MVGIFSKLSVYRNGHRRAHDVMDERDALPLNVEVTAVAATATVISHGIEVEVEFNPVEHPIEPLNNDHPIQCPLPEPSILNDGRIWKGRVSGNATRTGDLPMMPGAGAVEPTSTPKRKPPPPPHHPNGTILPSVSAPEHNLLKLPEECLPSVT